MRTSAKNGIVLALLIGFVLTTGVTAQEAKPPAGGKQPTAVIEELRHELGEQFERDVFRHTFKVKNTGEADLVIERVKPG